ncbi:MAG TPA: flagellar hook-associated protein FlgL [Deltaproteobacteria bacterium]|nr:flagellar hook-associated protein FlgL [Deltaproteobacteria bacterium]HRW80407.1 flagellar hook-associated protein FlgL [Desulfomonilia bacterium]NMD39438.1 flagellar hook-associated protein FlgL [Deltaproteobacteria bacterium]HOA43500.1 flagellar hook-associated protein FlgL [Deltaproteobacteria bacterium]HPH50490.1 flagellar hook-associated protein FlgL [Deltaproteobacteria bacterium]
MKVSNRFLYYQLVKDLNQNTEKLFRLNNQISSGRRVEKPSDDPIGLSSVLIYRTELNSFTQYKKSIDYGSGWLNRVDSILQDTDDLLARARELAVQASSATATENTRSGAAEEIKEIRSMVLSNANAKFGNKFMFGGTMTQTRPFLWVEAARLGADVATVSDLPASPAEGDAAMVTDQNMVYVYTDGEWRPVYQGNGSTFSMQIGKENSAQINIPGNEVFMDQQGDIFMTLLRLERALRSNDADAIRDELSSLEDAGTIVSNNLAKIGARVNKLEHTMAVIERSDVDTREMVSTIEDLDYAEAITQLQNQQTIYEAALKSASLITSLSLVDFI